MSKKRLCIDGRAAFESDSRGALAKELIDQLVESQIQGGEEKPMVLSHPDQHFDADVERFDTRKKIGNSFLYSAWEKNFLETESIQAFHRIRPIDRIHGHQPCPTVTTLLPASKKLPKSLYSSPQDKFIVPSQEDASLLKKRYGMDDEKVMVIAPSTRRFVHQIDSFEKTGEGWILLLTDSNYPMDITKLKSVLKDKYPHTPIRQVALCDENKFQPSDWISLLENAQIIFYLSDAPFDWPYLALEAFYFETPVIFPDSHKTLKEIIHHQVFRLSRFLVEMPSLHDLSIIASSERIYQSKKESFEAGVLAKQHRAAYDHFSMARGSNDEPREEVPNDLGTF